MSAVIVSIKGKTTRYKNISEAAYGVIGITYGIKYTYLVKHVKKLGGTISIDYGYRAMDLSTCKLLTLDGVNPGTGVCSGTFKKYECRYLNGNLLFKDSFYNDPDINGLIDKLSGIHVGGLTPYLIYSLQHNKYLYFASKKEVLSFLALRVFSTLSKYINTGKLYRYTYKLYTYNKKVADYYIQIKKERDEDVKKIMEQTI